MPGRPRLVNQVLLDRMVELRKQGFSHRDIAQKVKRSLRTVGRYLRGVSPQLQLPTTPKRVDVLAWCGARILAWVRPRWKLKPREVDVMLKRLRKVIADKDPLTVQWLSTNEEPRLKFLLYEFLPGALRNMETDRQFERIRQQLGGFDEWVGEEEPPHGRGG
ncbi:MAG: helix-turn-helix domain-containing protein [Candidatus Methylomirabilaceae bacterium]